MWETNIQYMTFRDAGAAGDSLQFWPLEPERPAAGAAVRFTFVLKGVIFSFKMAMF